MSITVVTRLILAVYFLEAGLVLMFAPWSGFWDRNAFARIPWIAEVVSNAFVRGAVTGIGLVTVAAGAAELAGAVGLRRGSTQTQAPRGAA